MSAEYKAEQKKLYTGQGAVSGYARLASIALAMGKAKRAIKWARRGMSLDPSNASILTLLARAYKASGQHASASGIWKQLADRHPQRLGKFDREWSLSLRTALKRALKRQRALSATQFLMTLSEHVPSEAKRHAKTVRKAWIDVAVLWIADGNGRQALNALGRGRSAGSTGSTDSRLDRLEGQAHALTGQMAKARLAMARWVRRGGGAASWQAVADFYVKQSAHVEAIWALQQALKIASDSPRIWISLARSQLGAHQSVAAKKSWEKALTLRHVRGKESQVFDLLTAAKAFQAKGYRHESKAFYAQALGASKYAWSVVKPYCDFLAQLNQRPEMASVITQYLALHGQRGSAVLHAVELLSRSGAVDQAQQVLGKALKDKRVTPDAWLTVADLYHQKLNKSARNKAITTYEKNQWDDATGLLRVARAWTRFRMFGRAMRSAKRVIQLAPAGSAAILLLANCHYQRGELKKEKALLDDFLASRSASPEARLRVGKWYHKTGREKRSRAILVKLTEPGNDTIRRNAFRVLAEIHFKGRNYSQAQDNYTSLLALMPSGKTRAALLQKLVRITFGVGGLASLRLQVLSELHQKEPGNLKLTRALGDLYFNQRRYSEARVIYAKAVKVSSEPSRLLQNVGRAFLNKQRVDDALFFLEQLRVDEITTPSLHKRLGQVWDARGERVLGGEHYAAYLKWLLKKKNRRRDVQRFGKELLHVRRYALAVKAYDFASKNGNKVVRREAEFGLGRAYLGLGKVVAARRVFESFLNGKQKRSFRNTIQRIASIYVRYGQLEDAVALLEEGLSYERPRWHSASFSSLCKLYRRLGRPEGVMRASRLLLRRSNNQARMVTHVVKELRATGLLAQAETILSDTIKRVRNPYLIHKALITVALLRGKHQVALRYAKAYVKSRVGRTDGWKKAAELLSAHGQPQLAVALLDIPLDERTNRARVAELFLARGSHRLKQGQAKAAHQDFKDAVARSFNTAKILREIRKLYNGAEQYELLLELEQRASVLMPVSVRQYLAVGQTLLAKGDVKAAHRAFRRYLERNERGHLAVAKTYEKHGYINLAIKHYGQVASASHNKGHEVFRDHVALLIAHHLDHQLEGALRRYLSLASDPSEGFRIIGQALRKAGHPARALEWFKRAVESKPLQETFFAMAEIFYGLDRFAEAREVFMRFVSANRRLRWRPTRTRMWSRAGEVVGFYLKRGRHDEALRFIQTSRGIPGLENWVVATEAFVHAHRGDVSRALNRLESLHRALERGQKSRYRPKREYLLKVVALLAAQGRNESALMLLEHFTGHVAVLDVLKLRLELVIRLGDEERIRKEIARFQALQPEHAGDEISAILFREGKLGLAKLVLQKKTKHVIKHSAARAIFRRLVALTAKAAYGKFKLRDGHESDLSNRTGGRADHLLDVAQLAFDTGDYQRARTLASDALALAPGKALLRIAVAANLVLGDVKRAIHHIKHYVPERYDRRYLFRRLLTQYPGANLPRFKLALLEELLTMNQMRHDDRHAAIAAALRAGLDARVSYHVTRYLKDTSYRPASLLKVARNYLDFNKPAEAARLLSKMGQVEGHLAVKRSIMALEIGVRRRDEKAVNTSLKHLKKEALGGESLTRVAELIESHGGRITLALSLVESRLDQTKKAWKLSALAARLAWRAGRDKTARNHLNDFLKDSRGLAGSVLSQWGQGLLVAAVWAGDRMSARRLSRWLTRTAGLAKLKVVSLLMDSIDHNPAGRAKTASSILVLADNLIDELSASGALTGGFRASCLAVLEEARGDNDSAISHYAAAHTREPHNASVINAYAYILARHGKDLPKALRLIRSAYTRAAKLEAAFVDTEAWILFKMGRYEQALKVIQQAIALVSGRPEGRFDTMAEMLYHLARIHEALGHRDAATLTYQRCVAGQGKSRYGRSCAARLKGVTPSLFD